jgi:hypothetical protein
MRQCISKRINEVLCTIYHAASIAATLDTKETMHVIGTVLIFLYYCCIAAAQEPARYAVAKSPIPVFNTPQAALPGTPLPPDRCGQVRQLEFIALPGTLFKIIESRPDLPAIVHVTTEAYRPSAGTRLYIATDQLAQQTSRPVQQLTPFPEKELVVQKLRSALGLPYVWGGNLREGILQDGVRRFAGLDCSGLLYEATSGFTPRNTDQLVQFGTALIIEGLPVEDILRLLHPLDLIVWQGHLVVVLDQETAIESILGCKRSRSGVVTTSLKKRLAQIIKQRKPSNSWPTEVGKTPRFVVRRWL